MLVHEINYCWIINSHTHIRQSNSKVDSEVLPAVSCSNVYHKTFSQERTPKSAGDLSHSGLVPTPGQEAHFMLR